jgi:hypothetical protein
MRFTDSKMLEIIQRQERLRAFKDKCQPYPAPELETFAAIKVPEPMPAYRKLDQLHAEFLFLQNKLNDHLDATKKRKQGKY